MWRLAQILKHFNLGRKNELIETMTFIYIIFNSNDKIVEWQISTFQEEKNRSFKRGHEQRFERYECGKCSTGAEKWLLTCIPTFAPLLLRQGWKLIKTKRCNAKKDVQSTMKLWNASQQSSAINMIIRAERHLALILEISFQCIYPLCSRESVFSKHINLTSETRNRKSTNLLQSNSRAQIHQEIAYFSNYGEMRCLVFATKKSRHHIPCRFDLILKPKSEGLYFFSIFTLFVSVHNMQVVLKCFRDTLHCFRHSISNFWLFAKQLHCVQNNNIFHICIC